MKPKATIQQQHTLLSNLQELPRKMLLLHGVDNITEFVLHELCQEKCFNIHKAAYFVDNPDFDCLKGVAGIDHEEGFIGNDIWHNPDNFSEHMKKSSFNKKVRNITQQSVQNKYLEEHALTYLLAQQLGMDQPKLFHWNMKHDNHGLLIIENKGDNHVWDDNYLLNSIHLLAFCPIH